MNSFHHWCTAIVVKNLKNAKIQVLVFVSIYKAPIGTLMQLLDVGTLDTPSN